jgi:predicted dienelactone hydrolase
MKKNEDKYYNKSNLFAIVILKEMDHRVRRVRVKQHFVIILLLCFAASFSCGGKSGPQLELPRPTGPFKVGTTWLDFTDPDRPETFTADPGDRRELSVRVWYPAEVTGSEEPCPYVESAAALPAQGLTEEVRLALARLNERLSSIKTHSYKNAPVRAGAGAFPVVLYSHGYWAGMNQSTTLMEELASHGFVTASIGHWFETNSVTRADGSVVRFDSRNPEFMLRGREREKSLPMERALAQTTDPAKLDSLFREIMATRPKTLESLGIWAADISFVIDRLEELNESHEMFKGKLDLGRIGVIGHSFGGAASGQVCLTDDRVTAGINMDGLQMGDMINRPVRKPFVFMHHDNQQAANVTPNINLFRRAEGPAYLIVIKGSGHYNFSDFSLPALSEVAPLPGGALGSIEGKRFIRILNDCVVTFFKVYLRNGEAGDKEIDRSTEQGRGRAPGKPK